MRDLYGNVIDFNSEEEKKEEHLAIKKQRSQRDQIANELQIDPNTTDPEELAIIDREYEFMLRRVNDWNEREKKKMDKILKKERGIIDDDEDD